MINSDYIAKKDVKNQSPIWQKKFVITRIKKKKLEALDPRKQIRSLI